MADPGDAVGVGIFQDLYTKAVEEGYAEAKESENVRFSKALRWSTVTFGRTIPGLIVEYVGIVPAQPIYLLPSLGFQVRFIKGRGPAPCLFFKTSDR